MPIPSIEELVGPLAALVLALYVIRELWISHKAEDARKDLMISTFPAAIKDLTDVVKDVAEREKTRGRSRAEDP
jgi:hypothetical protein